MLSRFVSSAQLQIPIDDAASLAQGFAVNAAELPGLAPGGRLAQLPCCPTRLPYQAVGVGLVDVHTQG